jgi:hypothetical protein
MLTVKHFSILSFLLLFIFSTNIISQDKKEEELNLAGKFALQFQIAENFRLSSFSGTTFSGKYHFSNCSAIRLSLSLSVSNTERDDDSTVRDSIFGDYDYIEYSGDMTSFRIDVQYLHNVFLNSDIVFYVGGGPFMKTQSQNENQTQSGSTNSIITKVKRETSLSSWGLGLVCGVEWFVKDNISLLGEYSSELAYTEGKSDREELTNVSRYDTSEITSWSFSANSVKLGVSVYF